MTSTRWRFAALVAIALGATAAGAMVALRGLHAKGRATAILSAPTSLTAGADRVEDVAILIGSPQCSASVLASLRSTVPRLIDSLRTAANREGRDFSTIGVSIDGPLSDGLAWLGRFGSFDETVIGRNWMNTVLIHYIWRDASPVAEVPQLLVVRRTVHKGAKRIDFGPDSLVHRWLGVNASDKSSQR